MSRVKPELLLEKFPVTLRYSVATQERATQDTTLRECNQFIEMMSMYVCAGFLRSQKYFARCRDNTSTTRAIPSANNQCKFALLTQTHIPTPSSTTTQLLPLEVPAAGTSDTESGLKYRLSPRHPSPLLSPLQLESSPLFPSSCSMVFRILDIALPLSYHATWMAHSRTRFA